MANDMQSTACPGRRLVPAMELYPATGVTPVMSQLLPNIDAQIESVGQLLTEAQQLLEQHEILLASAKELGDRELGRRARGLILTMREIRTERGRHLERLRSQAAALRAEDARLRATLPV
jgi:hypothetical protein